MKNSARFTERASGAIAAARDAAASLGHSYTVVGQGLVVDYVSHVGDMLTVDDELAAADAPVGAVTADGQERVADRSVADVDDDVSVEGHIQSLPID